MDHVDTGNRRGQGCLLCSAAHGRPSRRNRTAGDGGRCRVSNFGIVSKLVVPGDPSSMAANLAGSAGLFRLGDVGPVVFGAHLGVIGCLAWESGFIARPFGALLVVSGLGYPVDGFGTLLNPDYALAMSTYTFIGEVVFIFWLLIRGRQLPDLAVSNAEP